MNIRQATPQDAASIAELRSNTIRTVNVLDYPAEVVEEWALRVDANRILNSNSAVRRWVAEEVRGSMNIILGFSEHPRTDNELSRLYVHAEHQGEGIGSTLLKTAENSLRSAGHTEVYLFSTITARPFYLQHGYRTVQEVPDQKNSNIAVIKMIKNLLENSR